jgi:hypothetical protein
MVDNLRVALERNLAQFEAAGLTDDAKATKAKLAELDKAAEPEPEAENLDRLTKAELLDLAAERGVEVDDSMLKAELVAALEED